MMFKKGSKVRPIVVKGAPRSHGRAQSITSTFDHEDSELRANGKSFGHKVVDSISDRIGGGGYILVDDDIAFSSVVSNEPREKLSTILSEFRKTEQDLHR